MTWVANWLGQLADWIKGLDPDDLFDCWTDPDDDPAR